MGKYSLSLFLIIMPRLDGTGPLGQGARTGRGRGVAIKGRGNGSGGQRKGGSKECTCPKCGYKESHVRGVPCTEKKCPKCGNPMTGIFCS